ncbi:MAG: tripartite tricarboxylate transporter substrate-binding protein [Pseudolabrys sp.]
MTSFKTTARALAFAAATVAFAPGAASAADYPDHVVQLIVPFAAGGGVDTVGRIIAQKLSDALGQQVIVVNKPGAGSIIGVRDASHAKPDGYTLLMLVTGASLPPNTGYDLAKDFTPVGLVASVPIVIMSNPAVPVKNMADIAALAKKEPGKVTIGTPPSPTLNYFGAEQFKGMTGTDLLVVTYKGTGPLTNDLLGGHVMIAFNTLPPAIGNINVGKLRALAVAAPQRLSAIPNVPTTAEAGFKDLSIVQYYGIVAPAGTPRPIVDRLNKELRKILSDKTVVDRIVADGGGPIASTPEEYAANIKDNEGHWAALIKKLGLKVN